VRAKDMQINFELWPLIRKEFQIKRIILHEPVIHLIRNVNGDFNFATVGKKEKEEKVRGEVKKEKKPPSAKGLYGRALYLWWIFPAAICASAT
jgi:uncharacterized protein involved in outer membrane biogenesis